VSSPLTDARDSLWPRRYIRERQGEHIRKLPYRYQQVGVAALAITLLLLPIVGITDFWLTILLSVFISVVGAIGLNFLSGFSGQISLGQAAFLAVGAYTVAVLSGTYGMPFWVCLPAAAIVTAIVSVLIGFPSLRLRGFYVAMVTFAFHFLVQTVLSRWGYTGGSTGMAVERPVIAGFDLLDDRRFYYFVLAVCALMVYFAFTIERSYMARAWGAIRDRDLAAAAVGIPIARYKLFAYAWSGIYVGVAGGLLAWYFTYLTPENFPFLLAVSYLAMILIGGMGVVLGSILGAVFIVLVPEIVRLASDRLDDQIDLPVTFLADAQLVVFGLLIVLTVVYAPKGIYGFWQDAKQYFRSWPFTY
jgi:branched-chain amino acid transport system permease protein